MKKRKCLILTEGGRDVGFGHLTRCIALLQATKYIFPKTKTEFIYKGDKKATEFMNLYKIKAKNIDWIKKFKVISKNIDKYDNVIIDSYLAPKDIYFKLSDQIRGKILMIDDYKRIEYPKGIVVNPSIYGDKLGYPKNNQGKYLLGKEYVILRKEFWDIPDKRINSDVKNVLVTFGGVYESGFLERFLQFSAKRLPNFRYHIVSNCRIKNIFGLNLNIYGKLSSSEMLNLMLKADICIAGGGQTTYELARVGVPTIGICFADNQLNNLRYGNLHGYLKYVGNREEVGLFDKIKDSFGKIMPFEQRVKMCKLGRNNISGKGAKRIMETFIDINKAS